MIPGYFSKDVERESLTLLTPWIDVLTDHRNCRIAKGALAKELQIKHGDILASRRDGSGHISLECKAEKVQRANFFAETFSDLKTNELGWMQKTNADVVLYHFLSSDRVYVLHFERFRRWFFEHDQRGKPRCYGFEWVEQKKYVQNNETHGALVPIQAIFDARPRIYLGGCRPKSGQIDLFDEIHSFETAVPSAAEKHI